MHSADSQNNSYHTGLQYLIIHPLLPRIVVCLNSLPGHLVTLPFAKSQIPTLVKQMT